MDQIDKHGMINLVGAAVGNGVGGTDSATNGDGGRIRAKFYYGKGLYSTALKEQIEQECGSLNYPTESGWVDQTEKCAALLKQMNVEVGPHNFYNVDDFCPSAESGGYTLDEWVKSMSPLPDGGLPRMDALLHRDPTSGKSVRGCASLEGGSPLGIVEQWCGVDQAMMQWLTVPAVVEALHMTRPKGTEQNNLHYTGGYRRDDLRSLYKTLALKYRLWIYNGQEDGCIPYTGAEEWTSHLGFPVAKAWHPWFGGDGAGGTRVAAGYAVGYGGPAKDFAFITVKGAGHEVPTYKPQAAYTLFKAFLSGKQL